MFAIINVYFDNFIFKSYNWNLFKLFETALILASFDGHTEIVRLLLAHEGIDVNAKDFYLCSSKFISIIFNFKITIGIFSNYFKQHFFGDL